MAQMSKLTALLLCSFIAIALALQLIVFAIIATSPAVAQPRSLTKNTIPASKILPLAKILKEAKLLSY